MGHLKLYDISAPVVSKLTCKTSIVNLTNVFLVTDQTGAVPTVSLTTNARLTSQPPGTGPTNQLPVTRLSNLPFGISLTGHPDLSSILATCQIPA